MVDDGHLMLVAVPPSNLTQSMVQQPTHASCSSDTLMLENIEAAIRYIYTLHLRYVSFLDALASLKTMFKIK